MQRNQLSEIKNISRRSLLSNALTLTSAAAMVPTLGGLSPALAAVSDEAVLPVSSFPNIFLSRSRKLGSARKLGSKVDVLNFLPLSPSRIIDLSASERGAARDWLKYLDGLKSLDRMSQIRAVQKAINKYEYKPDLKLRGISDNWSPPPKLFLHGGDCEDYVVAKYLSLKYLGFHEDRLRMVALKLPQTRRAAPKRSMHAVLAVYLDGELNVLDNLYNYVYDHNDALNYHPLYSLNRTTLWMHSI